MVNLKIFLPVISAPLKIGCKITNTTNENNKTSNFDFITFLK